MKKAISSKTAKILETLKESGESGLDRLFISLRKMETAGLLDESIAALKSALKIFPKDRYLKFHLSTLKYRTGKYSDTEKSLIELSKENEITIDHSLLLAKALLMQEKYQEAERVISSIYDSEDDEISNIYGIILIKIGDLESSKEIFEKAIKVNPDNHFAYNNLAILHLKSNDQELALKYLKIAERLGKTNEFIQKNFKILSYDTALDNNPSPLENALFLYFNEKYEDAENTYASLISEGTSPYKEYNNLGCCYFKQRDFDNAEKSFRNSLIVTKNDFALLNLLKTSNKLGTLDFQFDEIKSSFGIELDSDVKRKITIDNIISPDELKVYTETIKKEVFLLFPDGKVPIEIHKNYLKPENNQNDIFPEIAGMKNLKRILSEEVVSVFKNPEKFSDYGISIPNGILMYGPPGCGKTYISTKLSEKLKIKMYKISASSIGSSYIHETARKTASIIKSAKKNAPSIIFIDEIDSLLMKRENLGSVDEYKLEEIGQFLESINNLSKHKVILIAATNSPGIIDDALLRTGRIDKLVYVGPPDMEARIELLSIEMKKRKKAGNIDFPLVSEMLSGYSCSDIVLIVEEAAKDAMKNDENISTKNFISVIRRNPPSIDLEMVKKYLSLKPRGG